ncbi:cytidylyltransferase domain-containing protein [Bdellovibrio bacteriovorus]|uniref:acylneuraminate cytidylyltransferase family protein n=1 Tax=Bdellovibrio bacteriovorus TaxID=959 RepID=UPI0035A71BB2
MKRLCSICARGGSKGVVGKNLREVDGKPLLAYSIEQAQKSGLFDAIAFSSDSDDILNAARDAGVKYLIKRPAELATDTAAKIPVIRHCAEEAEKMSGIRFDTFVDLDCTSPLRDVQDIINAVEMLEAGGCDNVITGMPARRSPYFNLVELKDGFVELSKKLERPVVRRQDAPQCYDLNASIYVWNRESFFHSQSLFTGKTKIYVMPEERSLDIDTQFDFEIVTSLLRKKNEAR